MRSRCGLAATAAAVVVIVYGAWAPFSLAHDRPMPTTPPPSYMIAEPLFVTRPAVTTTTEQATTTTQAPTTTVLEHPAPKEASRGAARTVTGDTVSSTAYCLTGHMATGKNTYEGAVAGNAWTLGTVLEVSDSPYGPGRFTVEDRIGYGSDLDFAMPGDCDGANDWGRRPVTVRVVADG